MKKIKIKFLVSHIMVPPDSWSQGSTDRLKIGPQRYDFEILVSTLYGG